MWGHDSAVDGSVAQLLEALCDCSNLWAGARPSMQACQGAPYVCTVRRLFLTVACPAYAGHLANLCYLEWPCELRVEA